MKLSRCYIVIISLLLSLVSNLLVAKVVETNEEEIVFGQSLFSGGFADTSLQGFNPEYRLSVGDTISLQLWGGYQVTTQLTVDAQGNVFIPNIGPVKLQGVANKDLNKVLSKKVSSVYQKNVKLYANLNAAQPVKLFVTGFVAKPGLYGGLSSDSILSYIEKAGGILGGSGSYLDIKLKRNNQVLNNFNLYKFILQGEIKHLQLHDGDVLVIGARQSTVVFKGLVENPVRYEFTGNTLPLDKALQVIGLSPHVTHLRLTRGNRKSQEVEYIDLVNSAEVIIHDGDMVAAVSDKAKGSIVVFVEGEHAGHAEYVFPYGTTFSELLDVIEPSKNSSLADAQLFREEIAKRQKEMIEVSLQRLEQTTFSARSGTVGEAQLRASDAALITQFIERAKNAEPLGQVILGGHENRNNVILKNRDKIYIPSKTSLVQVHGEVMFSSAMVWQEGLRVADYIEAAGGFTQKKNQSRVLIVQRDGAIRHLKLKQSDLDEDEAYVDPGDEILVMAQVDSKKMQFALDLTQIIFQIAMSARAVVNF